ncbi:hypothetical protein MUK42_09533 [Musa troglodytarum]|uniref:Uncharacterized protein n=1 Tax=Musa troglodytarum TaxID=320322 RepID=A0A9E7EBZ2_9LILI|nr:hypothetical protein MUK42_09533 [Musa troglodytarum]
MIKGFPVPAFGFDHRKRSFVPPHECPRLHSCLLRRNRATISRAGMPRRRTRGRRSGWRTSNTGWRRTTFVAASATPISKNLEGFILHPNWEW